MSDNKQKQDKVGKSLSGWGDSSSAEVPVVAKSSAKKADWFEPFKWKNVVPGHRCKNCGHCESGNGSEDRIILHVMKHVPQSEQSALLDALTKKEK